MASHERRIAQVMEDSKRPADRILQRGDQRTATRIPNTIPTIVARETAGRNTLRQATGKNPCGSDR